jgi:phage shock protein B
VGDLIALMLVVLVLPLIVVMHYVTKWKATRGLSAEEEQMLETLWNDAGRMDSRINSLETILDHEVPDWRKRV